MTFENLSRSDSIHGTNSVTICFDRPWGSEENFGNCFHFAQNFWQELQGRAVISNSSILMCHSVYSISSESCQIVSKKQLSIPKDFKQLINQCFSHGSVFVNRFKYNWFGGPFTPEEFRGSERYVRFIHCESLNNREKYCKTMTFHLLVRTRRAKHVDRQIPEGCSEWIGKGEAWITPGLSYM